MNRPYPLFCQAASEALELLDRSSPLKLSDTLSMVGKTRGSLRALGVCLRAGCD